jgi:hypothetical protein
MKTVTIGFSKARSNKALFSRAIMLAQNTPFSHVYTRVTWPASGQDIVYQASGTKVNVDSYAHFLTVEEVVAEFQVEVREETWAKIAKFMIDNLNKPYSIKEIVGMVLVIICKKLGISIANPFRDDHASFFCEELSADIFKMIHPEIKFDTESNGPKEFYDLLVEWDEK